MEFFDEVDHDGCKKVDIIPSEWFKGTDKKLCWWPPASLPNVTKAVKEGTSPASNWILCNVRVMGNAATYADARAKLHQAEYSSDLTDTEGGSRKRKASAKLLSQLSSQSESKEVKENALLKKQDNSVVEVPEGVVYPLKTQADIEALEEKLGDLSLMSAIVSVVTDIGGTSVDDVTRRMIKCFIE
ncbi:hypothetical protein DPEC_G00343090 [Dallia pectoralis]|uniref:Uncharacterized protein n=1 Tax=Dallia pectoralis TaxID=75939 RepID=A0ACC2F2V0_DALPE|nr:hypothetical protein DPEC_G00343090 [Dallia pectoralis]